jgi:hypothetical protein
MRVERAKVLDVADPEQRGRIRVSCAALAGAGVDLGVWIEPDMAFGSRGVGLFLLPSVGADVDLEFVDGTDDEVSGLTFLREPQFRWKASGWDQKSHLPTEFTGSGYGTRVGMATKTGSIVFDEDASKAILKSATIHLGAADADSPVTLADVLAPILKSLFDSIQNAYNGHTHLAPMVGATGPPQAPLALDYSDLDGESWHSNETFARRT